MNYELSMATPHGVNRVRGFSLPPEIMVSPIPPPPAFLGRDFEKASH